MTIQSVNEGHSPNSIQTWWNGVDDEPTGYCSSLPKSDLLSAVPLERLAGELAVKAIDSTLLRLLRQRETPHIVALLRLASSALMIGCFIRGGNYGTIIVDHETGRPIDLLPERGSETVKQWLEQHPNETFPPFMRRSANSGAMGGRKAT